MLEADVSYSKIAKYLKVHRLYNGDTYKFEIKLESDFRLLKLPNSNSVLSKGMINYWITKNGGDKGELKHKQDSLKKMYDSCYSSSDKVKDEDFWEEIIICANGSKLKEERKI